MQNRQFSWMPQFSWITLGFVTSLLFGMTACQPQSAAPSASAEKNTTEQSTQESTIKIPSKPMPVSASVSAIDAKTCVALSSAMQKVDKESKIEDIYAVQDTLKACLPTANNAEVLSLLKDYQAMYERFLRYDDTFNEDLFNDLFEVMSALEQDETISPAHLKKLPARVRYLIDLIQNDADVSLYNLGEGYYNFSHDLTAMAAIFTPYLRPDQRAFIERLAKDNQESFWSDASVTPTFDELIERALFWEGYIQRYPNGYSVADAKSLLDFYRYIIFFGADNTQWTDDARREFIYPEYQEEVIELTKLPNSILARDARNFLGFLALSDSKRQEKYPAPLIDDDGYEVNEWTAAYYQLDKAMQIPSIWNDSRTSERQCLKGVFCYNRDSE